MSETAKDGGFAFPGSNVTGYVSHLNGGPSEPIYAQHEGMSLRDWFAGQALAGLAHAAPHTEYPLPEIATDAYRLADAMLEERAKGETT